MVDLHDGQATLDLLTDLLTQRQQRIPRRPMTLRPDRTQ
jgi:hypothetical protein